MSHKDDINVLSGRLHRIIGMLCDLGDDLGIIYDELDTLEQTCDYKQAAEYWQRMYEESFAERTCRIVKTGSDSDYVDGWRYRCSECGCFIPVNERDPETGDVISAANYCPNCGARVTPKCSETTPKVVD